MKRILRFHRRRLTIVSDDPLVDGYDPTVCKLIDCEGMEVSRTFTVTKCMTYMPHLFLPSLSLFLGGSGEITTQPTSKSDDDLSPPLGCLSYKSVKGRAPYNLRKQNQDVCICAQDPRTSAVLLSVLDGHGEHGHKVSSAFRKKLAPMVFSHSEWPSNVRKAIGESIVSIEKELLADRMVETDFSGTTLVAAVIQGNHATVANIGDSRIILGKCNNGGGNGSLIAEELTYDHKPDLPKEKERILAAGGRVFAMQYQDGVIGPQRVWLADKDMPGLAMSRSLCDSVSH